jgi:hypothetical protein
MQGRVRRDLQTTAPRVARCSGVVDSLAHELRTPISHERSRSRGRIRREYHCPTGLDDVKEVHVQVLSRA